MVEREGPASCRIMGARLASIVLPVAGGPIILTLCPNAWRSLTSDRRNTCAARVTDVVPTGGGKPLISRRAPPASVTRGRRHARSKMTIARDAHGYDSVRITSRSIVAVRPATRETREPSHHSEDEVYGWHTSL